MALQKDETLLQGITLNYHRIVSFDVHLPDVNVTLASYVNGDLREQEKDRDAKQAELDALQAQVKEAQEESGYDPSADNPELAALGDEINELAAELAQQGTEKLYLKTIGVSVKLDGEATRDAIYTALKTLPAFTDATDC